MNGHSKTMAGEIEKRYWTVGEVADLLGVACSAVRYWTQEFGLDPTLKRSASHGNRLYRADDVEMMREIHRLLTVELYTIQGAKRQLERSKPVAQHRQIEIETILNPMP